VALERYKSAKGNYPETLDDLVPVYLEEVPLDPNTGRRTLEYKLAPDDATAFLLHPAGWSEDDEDYAQKVLFLRIAK